MKNRTRRARRVIANSKALLKRDPSRTGTIRRAMLRRLDAAYARLKGMVVARIGDFVPTTNLRGKDGRLGPGWQHNLGLSRSEMPQIKSDDVDHFLRWASRQGVYHTELNLQPEELHPTQAEFDQDRVDQQELPSSPIIVSSDHYVLDGTHRWIRHWQSDHPIDVIRLDTSVWDSLDLLKSYPQAKFSANAFCPTGGGGGVDPSCSPTPSGGILKKLGAAGAWIKDRTKKLFKQMEGRYGRKTAIAIFVAGHAVGLATPLVVLPGSTLIGMAPFAAVAEIIRGVRKLTGNAKNQPRDAHGRWTSEGGIDFGEGDDGATPRFKALLQDAIKQVDPRFLHDADAEFQVVREPTEEMKSRGVSLSTGAFADGPKIVLLESAMRSASASELAHVMAHEAGHKWEKKHGIVDSDDSHMWALIGDRSKLSADDKDRWKYVAKHDPEPIAEAIAQLAHPHDKTAWGIPTKEFESKFPGINAYAKSLWNDKGLAANTTKARVPEADSTEDEVPAVPTANTAPPEAIEVLLHALRHIAITAHRLFPASDSSSEPPKGPTTDGLGGLPIGNEAGDFSFETSETALHRFHHWLRQQYSTLGLDDESIWDRYISDGYRKGAGRAFDDTRATRFHDPADQPALHREEFLRSSFAHPASKAKVKLLASRTLMDIKNATTDLATKLGRVLVDGFVKGQSPRTIARTMVGEIDISRHRALNIARTEIIRVHAEGQLDAFEKMGVEELGVDVEFNAAGDACDECRDLSGTILSVDEARGLIPVHPQCQCAFIPAVRRRKPTRNIFCPTGPGGGVDATCSPGAGPRPISLADLRRTMAKAKSSDELETIAGKILDKFGVDDGDPMIHGMPKPEHMREASIGGIRIRWADGTRKSAAQVLAVLASTDIPKPVLEATHEITISNNANSQDWQWKMQYQNFKGSAATGGRGTICIYHASIERAGNKVSARVLTHEMGHNLAYKTWGSGDPPESSTFGSLQVVDHNNRVTNAVSTYGANSRSEDFAESVRLYITEKAAGTLLKDHPERHRALENIIERGIK